MRIPRSPLHLVLFTILLAAPLSATAQDDPGAPATSGSDRLFLAFASEAAVVQNQWWEGQFEFADQSAFDVFLLRGVVAVQPWKRWEMGARAGFGNTDTPAGVADGTGATDLDAWAKYYLGKSGDATEFAAGGLVTIPTGDDAAGLGTDSFSVGAFGSLRHRFDRFILSVHAGVRFNGDGQVFEDELRRELDGKASPTVGAGLIFPRSDRVTLVAEAVFEGARFDGADSDVRVLGGLNWRLFNRGMLRGALAIGLTDGAPDAQLLAAYAWTF